MQYRTQKIKSQHVVVNRQRVSTFDDLIVYISCNSLLDNGLEDAIYSERSDKFKSWCVY